MKREFQATDQAVDAHVWIIQTGYIAAEIFEMGRDSLSALENERLSGITHPKVAQQFRNGRILTRHIIGQYLNIAPHDLIFARTPSGRPYLDIKGFKLDFNISHSDDYFMLALSEQYTVGVDIERIHRRKRQDEIAARYFSPHEISRYLNLSDTDRNLYFSAVWTLKEALAKAHGAGIYRGLSAYNFDLSDAKSVVVRDGQGNRMLHHGQTIFVNADFMAGFVILDALCKEPPRVTFYHDIKGVAE